MTQNQKTLIKRAMANHPGKLLTFCGELTSWENSFTSECVDGKPHLFFWYNLESGATMTECMEI